MNKKQIVKKAVSKYTGKGGPGVGVADKIRRMREEDDRGMRIKTGAVKTPTPFGIIGESIKKFVKQKAKDRIQVQKNFGDREDNKDYYKGYTFWKNAK